MSTIRVGCAPIAWANDDMPELGGETTYQQILSEVALAGYEGTEIGNKYPKNPDTLSKELQLRNIRIAASWHGCHLTTEPYENEERKFLEFCDYMVALNADCINICEQGHSIQGMRDKSVFDDKPHFTDDEWERLANGLNRFGELAATKGLRLAYHHHMGTGVQTAAEIDRLMSMTHPDKLLLLVDNGHLLFAGENTADIIARYLNRIGHIHLKDIRPEIVEKTRNERLSFLDSILAGAFTVPGDGPTDFATLLQPVVDSNYNGWFMVEAEQDPALANPLEYALIARNYLRQSLGV